jgi:hypothetical protein
VSIEKSEFPFTDFFDLVRGFTKRIRNGRTLRTIYEHGLNEMTEELEPEITAVEEGRPEGEDGVVGEAMDVILCKLDMIFEHRPDITRDELLALALRKCQKWERKYHEKPSTDPR